ncbi:MAG: divalent metal cation transporter [Bacteroidota bacterium]
MSRKRISLGPAAMVAAAFIGPGTVTTASLAGAQTQFQLLWTVLFAILATIALQEMTVRLGIVGRLGLGEAIRQKIQSPALFIAAAFLVIAAIFIGNAAYETGNITGALLGIPPLEVHHAERSWNLWVFIIGGFAFLLLYLGNYKWIEGILIGLVGIMSLVFLTTAIYLQPPMGQILKGMFIPIIPEGQILLVVALIGTTIVPYNLFLHASASKEKWQSKDDLALGRRDTYISVTVGGIITLAIMLTAAMASKEGTQTISGLKDLSMMLEPLMGEWASTFLGIGFLAAGLSSSITAPLAAAYATRGIMGWGGDTKSPRFRAVWIIILLCGMAFSLLGMKPIMVIQFAQIANGILLPIVVAFLIWVMNDEALLGQHKNRLVANIIGVVILLVALILGSKSILKVFSLI